MSARVTDAMLADLRSRLPVGRAHPVSGATLAADLGVSERTVRELVGELVDRGVLVGSTCSGALAGYFLIDSPEDLQLGLRHLRSRAVSLFHRWSALKRAAEAQFSQHEVLRLFDLEVDA